jgi:uncharacterized protein Veg
MLQHMGGIHVVKRLVLEREGFDRREQQRKPELLDRFPSLGIVFWKEVDQMRRVVMRTMTGPDVQDASS